MISTGLNYRRSSAVCHRRLAVAFLGIAGVPPAVNS
jgi:hypothetical protein